MTGVRLPATPTKGLKLTAIASTVIAGGIFALGLGADITLTGFSRTAAVDVTGATASISCAIDLTSTNPPIEDAGCSFISPSGIVRSCSSSAPSAGTPTSGTWTCPVTLEANIEGGTWSLSYVFARNTATLASKYSVTNAEIVADAANIIGVTTSVDLDVIVTSTNADTKGPTISAAAAIPGTADPFFQIYGTVPSLCRSFGVVDPPPSPSGILDVGCSITDPSGVERAVCSSDTPVASNEYACGFQVPPGGPSGNYPIASFSRDVVGNRSRTPNEDFLISNTGGLTHEQCTTVTNGLPLALTVDTTGNAWFLSEFQTRLGFVDEASRGPCAVTELVIPHYSAGTKPFVYSGVYSQTSLWGESILYEPVSGLVYFSQGGAGGACNTTIPCTAACCSAGTPCSQNPPANLPTEECVDINHSRIVSYNPTGGVWKGYNLPGVRNESLGITWDSAREWLWAVEKGEYSDFIDIPCVADAGCDCNSSPTLACKHQGSIIAFKPSHPNIAEDINWQWEAEPGGGDLTVELCDGTVGNATPDDGCYQRFVLAVEDYYPAHLVVDPSGFVWYTNFWSLNDDGVTNSIGRLDPITGTVINYPTNVPRCTSPHACPVVGSGPWEIKISPDGKYVVFNEYFDSDLIRMPLAKATDVACQSRIGNENPCLEEIALEVSSAVVDIDWINIHSINFHPNGTLWFTAASPIDSVLTDNGLPTNYMASVLGFVDRDWTHITQLIPLDFTPDYNPTWDVSTAGIAINQATGEVWFNEFQPPAISRMTCVPSYTCASYSATCGTPPDGCGTPLASCGTCTLPDVCGGSTPYRCDPP